MRLLNVDTFKLQDYLDDTAPPYVIASHRWLEGEVTFQDVRDGTNTDAPGYKKVEAFARYVREHVSGIKWLWIDTCCINKDGAAELSESINCMFRWYRDAALCVAFLSDVEGVDGLVEFDRSTWFKRGWTLQELLAPYLVLFVNSSWEVIGHKGSATQEFLGVVGPDLAARICSATGISEAVLLDYDECGSVSVHERMRWIEGRKTTRPEDMVYALYGLLGVTLGANYGEDCEGAKQRLLVALRERIEAFDRMKAWLLPPDPWTTHQAARQLYESGTGIWLLSDEKYLAWKEGATRCLWLHGKAGSGKTVLCSTTVEDMRSHCIDQTAYGHAIFYFTFSDSAKQSYESFLVSLVAQLCWTGLGLAMLQRAYNHPARIHPGCRELESMLLASCASYRRVYIHVDALDECPESDRLRRAMLEGLSTLLQRSDNVHILATSRAELDIRFAMDELAAAKIAIEDAVVDSDIRQYVEKEMSRHNKLRRLDDSTKQLVQDTLVRKADGMFRWVYCQLLELMKSKHTGRRSVEIALSTLPLTLDATYERVLDSIHPSDRERAVTYLTWIAYARHPLSLTELAETGTITANDNQLIRDNVDEEDRGDPWDSLALLSGLIVEDAGVRFGKSDADFNDRIGEAAERTISQQEQRTGRRRMRGVSSSGGPIGWYEPRYESPGGGREGGPFLRLAHYSVKEYLESKRILTSAAKGFALATASGHRFIAQSSLVYLSHIVQGMQRVSAIERNILPTFNRLPLAEYVVCNWHEHARKQHWVGTRREVAFLSVRQNSSFWIGAKNYADCANLGSPETYDSDRTALQCAVIAGLIPVIDALLLAGADVYERAGYWGMNVLELASISGQVEVVAFLLRARPDLQERRMSRGLNALELAAESGHFEVVKALIRAGADSKERSACGDHTALSLASAEGHLEIVQALLQAGASVNDWDRGYMNARERASAKGHARIVEALLQAGALGNQSSRIFIAALYAAREGGYFKVEELLERAYWSRPGGCWTADHRSIGTQTD